MDDNDNAVLNGLIKMLEQLMYDKVHDNAPYISKYVKFLPGNGSFKEAIDLLKKLSKSESLSLTVAPSVKEEIREPHFDDIEKKILQDEKFLKSIINQILQNKEFIEKLKKEVVIEPKDEAAEETIPLPEEKQAEKIPEQNKLDTTVSSSIDISPQMQNDLDKIVQTYSTSTYHDGLRLSLQDEEAWAENPRHFHSLEEAKTIPLKEIQGNGRFCGIPTEAPYYFLVPAKNILFREETIMKFGYEEFFEFDSPDDLKGEYRKVELTRPAIIEKRGDLYYLSERGRITVKY